MSYDPSVYFQTQFTTVSTELPYLNRALATFVPSTAGFLAGFIANAEFTEPGGDGVAAVVTKANWQSKLNAWGATESEPIWRFCSGHFFQRGAADASGEQAAVVAPPALVLGRRLGAVVTDVTVDYTTNTAGTTVFTVNPSVFAETAGYLARVSIVADGVLTVTQLRDAAIAALNAVTAFAAVYLAAPGGGAGEFTITSLAAGYPTFLGISTTTGGPIVTQAVTTANAPGDYAADLDDLRTAAELSDDPITGAPKRRWYWITDLQVDDVVNAEGLEWVQDKGEELPVVDYQFKGFSNDPLNFDPLSAGASAAEVAAAANGGSGWDRGGLAQHDRNEALIGMLFGRSIGYLPGLISFSSKVFYGSTRYAKATPRDPGSNANLSAERHFDFYSADGPRGFYKWGYLANGSFMDRKWIEDYASYVGTQALVQWMSVRDVVSFTDADISAGAAVISRALLEIPGLAALPDELVVSSIPRASLDPNDVTDRTYIGYSWRGVYSDVINRMGTIASPITGIITATIS